MADDAAQAFIVAQRAQFDANVEEETSVHLQTPLQRVPPANLHELTI